MVLGFISLDYGEKLSASGEDERSILILAGGGLDSSDEAVGLIHTESHIMV